MVRRLCGGFMALLKMCGGHNASEGDVSAEDGGEDRGIFFDLQELEIATDSFSEKNRLGHGGFGPVYKGSMPCGEEIAVKKLSLNSRQGSREFMNEVKLLLRIQHKNLVSLLGCCFHGPEKMLVYEYLPNRSLDYFLFDKINPGLLDWSNRWRIIIGVARGLLYLHEEAPVRIIHRDIKASNILLDNDLNPKISDFGLARLFPGDGTHTNTFRISGTYGYMAPEYALHGLLSVKSDVFSFGVLVLEIVSGRKNQNHRLGPEMADLLSYQKKKKQKETQVMANLSSDLQTYTVDDPITQLAELNNTLHQFQTMFAPPFSSSLESLLFHHHQHQPLPDHFSGKSPENNFHQGVFVPSNIHNKNDESSSRVDTKKRKTLMASMSTSENSVSDQTSSAQVSINGNVLTKNSSSRRGKRSKNIEEKEREVVHVRAKRGQATDSHSLAERVRRGKINERLKCLQDIVPGCYKAMGMATMLDEIINYVQSLQNQVEFLSMKLTAASSYYDFNSEADAVDSMQKAKAREAVEMGQGRDGNSVFHSSSWTL